MRQNPHWIRDLDRTEEEVGAKIKELLLTYHNFNEDATKSGDTTSASGQVLFLRGTRSTTTTDKQTEQEGASC